MTEKAFTIPVAATPPTQPATPPPRESPSAVEARHRAARVQALNCAIAYAATDAIHTIGQFWDAVAMFEQYLTTGVTP